MTATLDDDTTEMLAKWELGKPILELLPPFVKEAGIKEWKGHYLRGSFFGAVEERLTRILRSSLLFWQRSVESLVVFKQALEVGFPGELLAEPVVIHPGFQDLDCPFCGDSLRLSFDGQAFSIAADLCPHPDGVISEWELNVPSGKLFVANDLRQWFPSDEDYDVNGIIGTHLTTMAYAKVGMAHGFVGNTCPDVYKDGDGFVIGGYSEELWDKDKEEEVPNPEPCPWGESVANVCTDLWWYSIVDYDELERRLPYYTPDATMEEVLKRGTIVDVKPGVYKFRQEQGVDRDQDLVEYASFKWDRDPEPVTDYLQIERDKSLGATEVLLQHCLSWPSLYMGGETEDKHRGIEMWNGFTPEQKAKSLARAADQIMCVLGGGVEWHENGFPRETISEEAHQLAAEYGEIPPFDFETSWYPISEGYGGLCLGAGVVGTSSYTKNNSLVDLAPDFVKLGLNICQNAIKFGEKPRLNKDVFPPAYEVGYARERMGTFVECYRGLRKRYQDIVFDAAFDTWLNDEEGVKEYVANFDFGPEHPPKEEWGEGPTTTKQGDYFEFDAMVLSNGYFCGDPRVRAGWARKEDAKWFALFIAGEGVTVLGVPNWKVMGTCAMRDDLNPAIPLRAVGRVLRGTGDGHTSKHLVVAFDYGTDTMTSEQFAFQEKDMGAVRQFDAPEEYEKLLETYKSEFDGMKKAKDSA